MASKGSKRNAVWCLLVVVLGLLVVKTAQAEVVARGSATECIDYCRRIKASDPIECISKCRRVGRKADATDVLAAPPVLLTESAPEARWEPQQVIKLYPA
jgi:hypothetical protein